MAAHANSSFNPIGWLHDDVDMSRGFSTILKSPIIIHLSGCPMPIEHKLRGGKVERTSGCYGRVEMFGSWKLTQAMTLRIER